MAVSVSVSSSLIDMNGSGTMTLDELYVAANAVSAGCMTRTGADPYVYQVVGNRQIEVSDGVTFNMDNAGDTLQWTLTGNLVNFELQAGGVFNIAENCTIIGDTNDTRYGLFYFYGTTSFQGTSGNEITFDKYYALRFFQRVGESHDWDYVIAQNMCYSSRGPGIWANQDPYCKWNLNLSNITVITDDNYGYGLSLSGGDFTDCVFDNWTIDNTRYGISSLYPAKFTNSTFQNMLYYHVVYSTGAEPYIYTTYDSTDPNKTNKFQPKVVFDTCTFDNNYTTSTPIAYYLTYSGVILFKDCTFQNARNGAWGNGTSKFLYQGTTTFTSITNDRGFAGNAEHYEVFALDLTVNDQNGDPIEDAYVTVRHVSDWESWNFQTNASGNIYDLFGDNPVFIYRQIISNTPTYINWSTSVPSLCHQIVITKEGYERYEQYVAFSSDQTITVNLRPATGLHISPISF